MESLWLYEWLEQNNIPPGLFVMLLLIVFLICIFIVCRIGDKPLLVDRCKNCIYIRQNTSKHYLCGEYKWLLFPWSEKKGPCPVEERWKLIDEDLRLAREHNPGGIIVNGILVQPDLLPLAEYETRKKEVEESAEPIEGIFYLYNSRIIPDFYSECLFSDKDNARRKEMYHTYFYRHYMRRRFTDLVSSNEKSIPRGRIAGTLSDPIIYIDGCYEQDNDILNQLKELYRLPDVVVLPNSNYRCPACYNKK